MRIIAGQARGVQLDAPKSIHVRPTQDRIREALFSILMPRLEDARFLDLFAGTGANGIEALSRGAASAMFVDSDERSLQFIKRNLAKTSLKMKGHVRRLQLPEQLPKLAADAPFDIIFADPPYKFTQYEKLLQRISDDAMLAAQGLVVIEHSRATRLPESTECWTQFRQNTYGDTALSFYERGREP